MRVIKVWLVVAKSNPNGRYQFVYRTKKEAEKEIEKMKIRELLKN